MIDSGHLLFPGVGITGKDSDFRCFLDLIDTYAVDVDACGFDFARSSLPELSDPATEMGERHRARRGSWRSSPRRLGVFQFVVF